MAIFRPSQKDFSCSDYLTPRRHYMFKVCEYCGMIRGGSEDPGCCQCEPDENGELPGVEEVDLNEWSDDGHDGDENSDFPSHD